MILEYLTMCDHIKMMEVEQVELSNGVLYVNSYIVDLSHDKSEEKILQCCYRILRRLWISGKNFINYRVLRDQAVAEILAEEEEKDD